MNSPAPRAHAKDTRPRAGKTPSVGAGPASHWLRDWEGPHVHTEDRRDQMMRYRESSSIETGPAGKGEGHGVTESRLSGLRFSWKQRHAEAGTLGPSRLDPKRLARGPLRKTVTRIFTPRGPG